MFVSHRTSQRTSHAVSVIWLRRHQLPVYFVLCFAITWPVQLLLIRTGAQYDVSGNPSVLISLAVAACGPSLAAFAVSARVAGWRGVVGLVAQARNWRTHRGWLVLALILPSFCLFAGVVLFALLTHALPKGWTWVQAPPGKMALAAVVPALGEEFGWRAFALPKLQRRTNGLFAAVFIGVVWGMWHLPIFFFPGMPIGDIPFFLTQVIAASVVMTWMYNSTGGQLSIVLVAHFMFNLIFVDYPPIVPNGPRPIACAALVAITGASLIAICGGRSLTRLNGLDALLLRPSKKTGVPKKVDASPPEEQEAA